MAIAVLPEGPRNRLERVGEAVLVVVVVAIVVLFVYSLLDAYVF